MRRKDRCGPQAHRRRSGQHADGTTIVKEYPFAYSGAEGEIPYYAILNEENQSLYEKYKALTGKYPNMHLLGRLAEYKYYDMDDVIASALSCIERWK